MHPIHVTFPGGKRVDARFEGFVVHTDQPVEKGGEGSAPDPFALFLSSLAACAGFYVLAFCQTRGIPTEGLGVDLEPNAEASGRLSSVRIRIDLPAGFPGKYVDGVRRAADACKVKATLSNPPVVEVVAGIHPST